MVQKEWMEGEKEGKDRKGQGFGKEKKQGETKRLPEKPNEKIGGCWGKRTGKREKDSKERQRKSRKERGWSKG